MKYKVLNGISFGETNLEVDEEVDADALPAESIPWLVEQGHIAEVQESVRPATPPSPWSEHAPGEEHAQ